jgi:hypothetical protein
LPNVDFWNPFLVENLIYGENYAENGGLHILDISSKINCSQVGFYRGRGSIFATFIKNE